MQTSAFEGRKSHTNRRSQQQPVYRGSMGHPPCQEYDRRDLTSFFNQSDEHRTAQGEALIGVRWSGNQKGFEY